MTERLSRRNLMLLALVLSFLQLGLSSLQCSKYDSNMGATYDLNDLYRDSTVPPYIIEDGDIPCTSKIEPNYTYIFNVCGPVNNQIPSKCRTGTNEGAAALQVNQQGTISEADDWCYMVGRYEESTKLELLDPQDPTVGLKLSYFGDICSSGKQRQFQISLGCADKLAAVPNSALEFDTCVYTVDMPSIYGCPLECGIANRKLCGGNGYCSYDTDAGSARCFCNKGYSGSTCTANTSSTLNYSPALLGLIITLFIIVVILAGSIAYMMRQMSAYKEDLAHYQVLKGGEDETAVV